MKKALSIALILLSSVVIYAGDRQKVGFAYDLDFEMRFDNREYYRSAFTNSMTIFGARLVPSAGVMFNEKNGACHRLMAGVDVMKDFGAHATPLEQAGKKILNEFLFYYRLDKKSGQNAMKIYAGIFPRTAMSGSYSQAFFSDSLKFYDNNIEGLLLKLQRPAAYFELGCDWMGKYGADRREKFMVFTAGEGKILPYMSLGYAGYMLHYANSDLSKGLVDNILLNPYARFDLGEISGIQTLSFRLGWLQAIQRDRAYAGIFVYPYGLEFDQQVRQWNIGIHNRLFYGHDMMPYYNNVDNAGLKYGASLYFGDPFYRVHDDGSKGPGIYDRLEVFYEPKIGDFLSIRVSAMFHFHNHGYSGCQQMVSLRLNLNNR